MRINNIIANLDSVHKKLILCNVAVSIVSDVKGDVLASYQRTPWDLYFINLILNSWCVRSFRVASYHDCPTHDQSHDRLGSHKHAESVAYLLIIGY